MEKYILLGIIQGITEFFPISSSAHLVIFQKIFGITGQELGLSIVLHLGTIFSLLIYFLKDILNLFKNIKLILLILVVTLVTGIIGILGKDFFESLFSLPKPVAVALIFTGIILIFTKKIKNNLKDTINFKDALILGLFQGLAIIPGISRSGITISTLLLRKIDKETSFRFSFLASIPAVFGATLLEAKKIEFAFKTNISGIIAGFIFSFLSGIFALGILKRVLNKAKFYYFGYYCIFLAIFTLIFIK